MLHPLLHFFLIPASNIAEKESLKKQLGVTFRNVYTFIGMSFEKSKRRNPHALNILCADMLTKACLLALLLQKDAYIQKWFHRSWGYCVHRLCLYISF